jgi:hypothetical protein
VLIEAGDLAHIGFGMPLAIYILRNYMSTPWPAWSSSRTRAGSC